MTIRRIMVIVNPYAGTGKGKKILVEVRDWKERIFREKGIEADIEITSRYGLKTAASLTRIAVQQKYDLVVAVGGDGTVSEIVNVLVGTDIPLGIVRTGTTNDFAANLGIPKDPKAALNLAIDGKILPIEVGEVNGKFFISSFGLGIAAGIIVHSGRLKSKWPFLPKILLYLIGFARDLFFGTNYPNLMVKKPDGETITSGRITLLSVSNIPVSAKIFKLTPQADPTDGFLNIFCLKNVTPVRFLCLMPKAIKGDFNDCKELVRDENNALPKISSIVISSLEDVGIPSQLDGDFFSIQRVYRVRVVPSALRVVVSDVSVDNKNRMTGTQQLSQV